MPPWPWVSSTSPPLALGQVALPPGPSRERVGTRGTGRPPVRTRRKGGPRRPRAARVGARGVVKGPGALALPWNRWGRRAPGPQACTPTPGCMELTLLACSSRDLFSTLMSAAPAARASRPWPPAGRGRTPVTDREYRIEHPALLLGQQSEVNNKKSVNTEVKNQRLRPASDTSRPAGSAKSRQTGCCPRSSSGRSSGRMSA